MLHNIHKMLGNNQNPGSAVTQALDDHKKLKSKSDQLKKQKNLNKTTKISKQS